MMYPPWKGPILGLNIVPGGGVHCFFWTGGGGLGGFPLWGEKQHPDCGNKWANVGIKGLLSPPPPGGGGFGRHIAHPRSGARGTKK